MGNKHLVAFHIRIIDFRLVIGVRFQVSGVRIDRPEISGSQNLTPET
jgi:hypothetical protein